MADEFGNFSTQLGSDAPVQVAIATIRYAGQELVKTLERPCQGPKRPTSKAQCKRGGWKQFGFKNQGRCIAFVNRGPKHARAAH
jgi:hypothetical protein